MVTHANLATYANVYVPAGPGGCYAPCVNLPTCGEEGDGGGTNNAKALTQNGPRMHDQPCIAVYRNRLSM